MEHPDANKVLACVDGSRSTASVCDHAVWAGQRLQSPLTFLHVIKHVHAEIKPDLSGSLALGARENLLNAMVAAEETQGRLLREQGRAVLNAVVQRAIGQGVERPGMLLCNDRVLSAIRALESEARLIVVGKQGQDGDMVERHVGSHLESLIRTVQRAVLVAPLTFRRPERFLIAYDGRSTAGVVVDRVAASPLLKGLEGRLLMVSEDRAAAEDTLRGVQQQLAERGMAVDVLVRSGSVAETVYNTCQETNTHLLVMGAFGHSGLRRWFVGSTTTEMIMRSPIPLLVVR